VLDSRRHRSRDPVAQEPPPLPPVTPLPLPAPIDVHAGPTVPTIPTDLPAPAAARRDARLSRKRRLGRTRGHATGQRVAAGARTAAAASGVVSARVAATVFRPVTLSRRQALAAAGAAAAAGSLGAVALGDRVPLGSTAQSLAAGAKAKAGAAPAGSTAATLQLGTTPAPPSLVPVPVARGLTVDHLVRRVTFGATPALRADVEGLGMSNWLALQLAPARIADPLGQKVNALYPRLNWSLARVHALQKQNDQYYSFLYEPGLLHIGRAVWSKHQLHEMMVDFWSNHLNVPAPADKGSFARHRYDADVIRKHALGRFEDMLVASSQHPSMLAYLDSILSTREAPNENYAREIMELHTLGVDGGYTERDIKQAAILLTGWEMDEQGVTRFRPDRHDPRPVTILGRRWANGRGTTGRQAQLYFVRYLATHPSTARYVCRKLAIRFVSDDPPKQLVDALAATYLRHTTHIVPVLRQIFASPEFAAADGEKARRPLERLIAVVRTLDPRFTANTEGLQQLYWMTQSAGQTPFAWPTPDGYADIASKWQSPASALELINLTSALVHGWWPDKLGLPGAKKLLAKPPANRSATIDAVGRKVLGRLPTAQERTAVNQLLASTELPTSYRNDAWGREETAALSALVLMTSPAFLSR